NIDEAVDRPIELAPATIAKIANSTTCGRRYSFPSARLGSSISVNRSTNELNGAMATSCAVWLPAKESHGTASQESPTPLPDGGLHQRVAFRTHPVQDESAEQPCGWSQAVTASKEFHQ